MWEYKVLENPNFSKGDRVEATRDVKLHFGGTLKKGEKGTFLRTELIGEGVWTVVEMDSGFTMSFTRDSDIKLISE